MPPDRKGTPRRRPCSRPKTAQISSSDDTAAISARGAHPTAHHLLQSINFATMQDAMDSIKIMAIIQAILGFALLLAGIFAATKRMPDYICDADSDQSCALNRDRREKDNDMLLIVTLCGTLHGVIPFGFGLVGVFGTWKANRALLRVSMHFSIIGIFFSFIGLLASFLSAAAISNNCSDSGLWQGWVRKDVGDSFCDTHGGAKWAAVGLNIILTVWQLVISICYCRALRLTRGATLDFAAAHEHPRTVVQAIPVGESAEPSPDHGPFGRHETQPKQPGMPLQYEMQPVIGQSSVGYACLGP
eukprot:2684590-Rhodomonas_salina.1